MSTAAFVEQLYTKFLFRNSDAAGKADWVNRLDTGEESIAQVTYNFALSQEFTQRAESVSELYFLLFGRVPDSEGMQHWLDKIDQGLSTDDLAQLFMSSEEFASKYGQITDNTAFINQLYQQSVGEFPNTGEQATFIHWLNNDGLSSAIRQLADYHPIVQKHGTEIKNTGIYYGILGRAPSEEELEEAPNSPLDLINTLYTHTDYVGEALPETNFIGFVENNTTVMENDGTATVSITRSGSLDNAATVQYTLSEVGDTQADDFGITEGTVTFEAGALSATIQLSIADNNIPQLNRSYQLELAETDTGNIAPARSTLYVHINDEDELEFTPPAPISVSSLAATNGITLSGVTEQAKAGHSVVAVGDVNGDGLNDFIVEAETESYLVFGDENLADIQLAAEYFDGSNGVTITGTFTKTSIYGDSGVFNFPRISAAGDINGDGFDDIIFSDGDGWEHRAYLLFGKGDGWDASITPFETGENATLITPDSGNGVIFNSSHLSSGAGLYVEGVGDVNGDGVDDLFIGSKESLRPVGEDNLHSQGALIFGHTENWETSFDLATFTNTQGVIFSANQESRSDDTYEFVRKAVFVGDLNNDGIDDLLLAPEQTTSYALPPRIYYSITANDGSARLINGQTTDWSSPIVLSDDSQNQIISITTSKSFSAVTSAGDFNGDGIADVMFKNFAANGQYEKTTISLIFGQENNIQSGLLADYVDGADGTIISYSYDENAIPYDANTSIGDINHDGYDDLLVSLNSDQHDGSAVVFGREVTPGDLIDLYAHLQLGGPLLQAGSDGTVDFSSAVGLGDVNGDGIDDFILGASGIDQVEASGAGEAYLIFGSDSLLI